MSTASTAPEVGLRWFRMYAEFAHDLKVQAMTEPMQRRLTMLFCIQCETGIDNLPEDDRDASMGLAMRISPDEVAATRAEFIKRGFIDADWTLRNWDRRQYVSDSSTARVRKHRAAKRVGAEIAKPCRGMDGPSGETLHETFPQRFMKLEGNVSVTVPDADTDTDTERAVERETPNAGAFAATAEAVAPLALSSATPDEPKPTRRGLHAKSGKVTLAECFAKLVKAEGEDAKLISDDDPIREWANTVGMPPDVLRVCWFGFVRDHTGDGSRAQEKYIDWRATFRNAARKNWGYLWRISRDGSYYLSDTGKALEREMQAEVSAPPALCAPSKRLNVMQPIATDRSGPSTQDARPMKTKAPESSTSTPH